MKRLNVLQRWAARVLGIRAAADPAGWPAAAATAVATSGQAVTTDAMLRLSAVWACTRLISETVATLPLGIHERSPTGRRVAADHGLHEVLRHSPNEDATAAVYWESVVAAMLLRGVACSEKLMVGDRVVGLRFLAPDRLSSRKEAAGAVRFRYRDDAGREREIPPDRIWAVPGFSLDGQTGVSVVAYGAEVFGAALAADEAAASTFRNGMLPAVYFKMERILSPEQRAEFRERLAEITGSFNAGRSPLLEAGMSVGNIGISPADAQLLESRGFSVETICRWFRVPPFMVGHSTNSTSWGTGIEQQMIGFLTFTLAPWLRRIEQAISKDLLTPAERLRFYPRYSVEGLLRADSAGRSSFYSSMVNNGILTRDEVRALEDREPMGGNAAVLTVQTAMAPLDDLRRTAV